MRGSANPSRRPHAARPFPPTGEVAPGQSIPGDKDSLRRTRRSRESSEALPQCRQQPPGKASATRARRDNFYSCYKRQTSAPTASLNFQNALYLELPGANAVGFVPVKLSMTYRTIGQLQGCRSLQLPPAAAVVEFSQPPPLTNSLARGNRLRIRDIDRGS